MLFPTTIVGSFPQPDWLIDREKLAGRFPPRVRAKELWRPAPEFLEEAWNDATLLAIRRRVELLVNLPPEQFAPARLQASARDLARHAAEASTLGPR